MIFWEDRAWAMASEIADSRSLWNEAVLSVPRHELVWRWFTPSPGGKAWELHDGPSDENAWLDAAYDGRTTLVTRIGATHADHAAPGTTSDGSPTSSAAAPGLVIGMYRHARIYPGCDILDVGTGPGYGAALLARRFGDQHVTSIDTDHYLTNAATVRLSGLGLHPLILTCDAASDLPGAYDRIVSMVSLPAIPASWLDALRPGGRLVFSLTGGSVLITADKTPDGGAQGRVEYDRASFTADRPNPLPGAPEPGFRHGEHVTASRSPYPIVDPAGGRELDAIMSVSAPGITCHSRTDPQTGVTTTWLTHDDGSWARATGKDGQPARVHQSGPRRLWDLLDEHRSHWLARGCLPLRGAQARIDPDGTCHLSQGRWHATIPPQCETAQ